MDSSIFVDSLEEVGSLGKAQFYLVALAFSMGLLFGWLTVIPVFTLLHVDFTCDYYQGRGHEIFPTFSRSFSVGVFCDRATNYKTFAIVAGCRL